ncbi:hypothetical protein Dimus_024701 [Dionaea muscipula]
MAKTKNEASSSSSAKKKSPQKKKPAPKVFRVIIDVRSSIDPELFETVEADVPVLGEEKKTRKRRCLKKATFIELDAAGDSEETQSDKDVPLERLVADLVMDKGKVSLVESGTKPRKEPVVSGSPTVEELDQQVDELLARLFVPQAVHEGEIDKGRMMRSGMDAMMGAANHATIRAPCNVPLKHKCAILCRNMAEMSLLTGDVLYAAVRTYIQRCRKIDKLMEEKYALEREVKELKLEYDNAFETSTQMKADVDMVMEENQTLENENKELKTALEGEKNKVQTLEDKVKELQMALESEKER